MKVVWLSTLRTGRLYPSGKIPGTQFCYWLSRPEGHSATGRFKLMKNFSDAIGNTTGALPTCSANCATAYPLPSCNLSVITVPPYTFWLHHFPRLMFPFWYFATPPTLQRIFSFIYWGQTVFLCQTIPQRGRTLVDMKVGDREKNGAWLVLSLWVFEQRLLHSVV